MERRRYDAAPVRSCAADRRRPDPGRARQLDDDLQRRRRQLAHRDRSVDPRRTAPFRTPIRSPLPGPASRGCRSNGSPRCAMAAAYRIAGYSGIAALVTAALMALHALVFFNAARFARPWVAVGIVRDGCGADPDDAGAPASARLAADRVVDLADAAGTRAGSRAAACRRLADGDLGEPPRQLRHGPGDRRGVRAGGAGGIARPPAHFANGDCSASLAWSRSSSTAMASTACFTPCGSPISPCFR